MCIRCSICAATPCTFLPTLPCFVILLCLTVAQDLAMAYIVHQYFCTLADCLDHGDCLVTFLFLGTSTASIINGEAQTLMAACRFLCSYFLQSYFSLFFLEVEGTFPTTTSLLIGVLLPFFSFCLSFSSFLSYTA